MIRPSVYIIPTKYYKLKSMDIIVLVDKSSKQTYKIQVYKSLGGMQFVHNSVDITHQHQLYVLKVSIASLLIKISCMCTRMPSK